MEYKIERVKIMSLLQSLNKEQKEAVKNIEGAMLVIAGAGSGKTRVLTNRIAYMIKEMGIGPENILAITFTNKAANEMKERVATLVGKRAKEIWISTFHSTCVRILREEIHNLGYSSNFTIYDDDDKKRIVKDCMLTLNINEQKIFAKTIMRYISQNKNSFVSVEEAKKEAGRDPIAAQCAKVYDMYEEILAKNNSLDFDDLIKKTIELFNEFPKVLKKYQTRFQYIMVDEYQDTNHIQYLLIQLLSDKYKHLFVVGDDDQSIYKWRGADIYNILNFEQDFKKAKVIRLEQNYRSTGNILSLANAVISNNTERKTKSLWTEKEGGDLISLYYGYDEREESNFVTETIQTAVRAKNKNFSDFAVLYRTNAQSRLIEEQLVKEGIPYEIFGGIRYYERKEVKDILSYLKVIINPDDEISIKRVINIPKRNIGNTTIEKIEKIAKKYNISLYEALRDCSKYKEIAKLDYKIERFTSIIENAKKSLETDSLKEMITALIENTNYKQMLEEEETQEAKDRIENLSEFVSKVAYFEQTEENPTLEKFVEEVTLLSDIDRLDENVDAVKLMTIHMAKGLEFDTVFLTGFEDGIFPSYLSIFEDKNNEIEEERRLLYVAITRAREKLYITHTKSRLKNGQVNHNKISRFYEEFPEELIESKKKKVKKLKLDFNIEERPTPNLYSMLINTSNEIKKLVTPENVAMSFKVGDKVGHKKFGKGVVKNVMPAGADYELTVHFEDIGTKKLMSTFANLEAYGAKKL